MSELVRQQLPPDLSAAVVVGQVRDRPERCLNALLAQAGDLRLEVLIVDLAVAGTPPLEGADHPSVRILRLPPDTPFGEARATAVREARAPFIAFLEEHTEPRPGWAVHLLAGFDQGSFAGVGPLIVSGNPGVGTSDISGLLSYGLFFAPQTAGEAPVIPGMNSAYRRSELLRYGEDLPELLLTDLVLIHRLRRDGRPLAMAPQAVVAHWNETRLGEMLRGYFLFHRCFGHLRARHLGWSPLRRLVYMVLAPLIPWYYLQGFGRRLRRLGRREDLARLLRSMPLVLLIQGVAAWGQAVGLVAGMGKAPAAFRDFELACPARTDSPSA